MVQSIRRILILLLVALVIPSGLTAQESAIANSSVSVTVEVDPFGRQTPRSAVTGLIGALAQRDYDRAANYFNLPVQKDARVLNGTAELARRLQVLLDGGGTLVPFAGLSNDAIGRVDDDLPVDQERVGSVLIGEEEVPILLTRSDAEGQQVWRISHGTIRRLMAVHPTAVAEAAKPETKVPSVDVGGAPIEDWALLIGFAALSFVILRLMATGILTVVRRGVSDPDANGFYRFLHAALPPLSLFIAVLLFYGWAERLEVAIVARQTLLRYAGGVAAVALVWFGLRLVDAIADVAIARMHRRARRQAASVVTLLRRAAKILLLVISIVSVLDTFGIDVTTGIAALGIGGIALALGAQKTVENLVGSVTVIADRPVQVGDFCRVGDVVGTVEDVGIRSTRIRTNERTIVTIPNGDFASRQIENFAKRDRYLFAPTLGIDYRTPAAKVREAVAIIERTLVEHEKVITEGARARFSAFGESSLNIEVFSYIGVLDFGESVTIRQDLLLTIYERFEEAGIAMALPSQTYFLADEGASGTRTDDDGAVPAQNRSRPDRTSEERA